MSVAAAQDWDSVFPLDRYCMVEFQFWKNNRRSVKSKIVSNLAFLSYLFTAQAILLGKMCTLTGCLQKQNARRAPLTVS